MELKKTFLKFQMNYLVWRDKSLIMWVNPTMLVSTESQLTATVDQFLDACVRVNLLVPVEMFRGKDAN